MGRLFLPNFDGSSKCSAKSWVEKLEIYFQLNKVPDMEAIKIVALHLEGEAHDWWFHGLYTLGHANVTVYSELTRRLVEIFDRRDLDAPFMCFTFKVQRYNLNGLHLQNLVQLKVDVKFFYPRFGRTLG